ncbi:urease accessory protein UreF [Phreatobacter oligotrophus]|jgi:urease accessory protein|uniref:urease accessory protein UreF n=1 Tax=Phreatobacter oligotrophus TaxID=1122261 RepID=UPI002354AC64|nr:urease accessory protein UreF [Phreatobacter oligotrophus]MBX9989910.1 urease accessory protein UreF [Phreatobacter oligotrophus]
MTIITTTITTTTTTMPMVTAITTATTTSMAETAAAAALYRLLAWMSPAYPVGAFSYSHGLEWAVETGDITDLKSLVGWLTVVLEEGSGVADATFCAHAHRAVSAGDAAALAEVAELALAFQPSKERRLETTAQGNAFMAATEAAWPVAPLALVRGAWDGPVAYPVAVGAATAAHGIAEATAVHAFLHAVAANLISAAVRLVPLGQTDGQRALAALEPVVGATAGVARSLALDAIGGHALRSDLASMRHETQYTRLFRS